MKKILLISLVTVLSGLAFHSWFSFSVFNAGDWRFAYSENLKEDVFPSAWIHGEQFGFLSAVLWSYPQKLLSGVFGVLGFDWNIAEKMIILWPIIILIPVSSYLILRSSGFGTLPASIGSMYLTLNSYFLSITTQGHQFLTGAAIWGVLSLYFLMRMREEMRGRWAVMAGITLSVAGSYDFRMAYIFLGVGVLYFLWEWWGMVRPHPNPSPFHRLTHLRHSLFSDSSARWSRKLDTKKVREEGGEEPLPNPPLEKGRRKKGCEMGGGQLLRLFGMFVAVFVGLNVFWILPFGAAGAVGLENAGMGRDLFGNDAFELDDAMYLSHPFWTGYGVKWFSDQATPWWLSILGVLAWVGFWVGRKNRTVVFFALLSVLGILLGKQVSEPWGNLYYFLYDHVPGFSAFREASKFYILVVLGYAVGIGALVQGLLSKSNEQPTTDNSQQGRGRAGKLQQAEGKNPSLTLPLKKGGGYWWLRYVAVAGIAGLILWNANSLVTGRIGTMFIPREIHSDYYRYREFINGQSDYFRVLSVPAPSKWMVYTNMHPRVSAVELMRGAWSDFALPSMGGHPERNERKVLSPLEQNFSDRLLDVSAIRYVVVPRDDEANADVMFDDYGKRDIFIAHLDALPYLSRVDAGTGDVIVYENADARPHIYLTDEPETIRENVTFREVSYEMASPSEYRVEISNTPPQSSPQKGEEVYLNFAERYHPGWKVRIGAFSWWDALRSPGYFIPDTSHTKNDAGLNSFRLDRSSLIPDEDGVVRLTVFFRPQAYLYLGLGISGAVLVGCLGYLGKVLMFRRKNPKKDKSETSNP